MDVIFDVDGTLLDITHRIPLIRPPQGTKPNWKAFRAASYLDPPNVTIILIFRSLIEGGHRVALCTGRMESERAQTEATLHNYGVVFWEHLLMRPEEDYRPDHVIKLEMLNKLRTREFNPVLAFDDRQQVVDMWRAQGLTCCQVAPGNF